MIRPDRLAYPALCLARDDSISVVHSAAELCRCNAIAWFRNRYFDRLRIYDARAEPYEVRSAWLAVPLVGWRRLIARVANRPLAVRLDLERTGPPSLEGAKAEAIQWLQRAPEFWESAYDLSHWQRRIGQASDMRSLCEVFE